MSSAAPFYPSQILCIDHNGTSLYAEVIQVAEVRSLCWVRPFALIRGGDASSEASGIASTNKDENRSDAAIQDLRGGADLLLPIQLFRAALDVEVIPLLGILSEPKNQCGSDRTAHSCLQNFTRDLWRAHPEIFST